jgi:hypothetical protein
VRKDEGKKKGGGGKKRVGRKDENRESENESLHEILNP